MNCPYCDRFSPSSITCVHCGEKLPATSKSRKSSSFSSGSGSGFVTKILLMVLGALVIYGAYTLFFKQGGSDIPSYMSDGPVNLKEMIVRGEMNIVDLYSDYCPPCVQIAPYLKKLDEIRDDIVIVKIDINRSGVTGIDWQSPVARQFKLRSIPHFIVVSPSGKVKFQGKKAYQFVLDQLREEGLI
ncbi:MAG: thioredoxin family protein [Candidatus Aminicenantes bacterium]|nr:MAG: thioredoxin family protein [Candidatus Aminicenantes bacterium]